MEAHGVWRVIDPRFNGMNSLVLHDSHQSRVPGSPDELRCKLMCDTMKIAARLAAHVKQHASADSRSL